MKPKTNTLINWRKAITKINRKTKTFQRTDFYNCNKKKSFPENRIKRFKWMYVNNLNNLSTIIFIPHKNTFANKQKPQVSRNLSKYLSFLEKSLQHFRNQEIGVSSPWMSLSWALKFLCDTLKYFLAFKEGF